RVDLPTTSWAGASQPSSSASTESCCPGSTSSAPSSGEVSRSDGTGTRGCSTSRSQAQHSSMSRLARMALDPQPQAQLRSEREAPRRPRARLGLEVQPATAGGELEHEADLVAEPDRGA